MAEVMAAITLRLIVEMRRGRIAIFAAGRNRPCRDLWPEIDDRDEAVAIAAVPALRARPGCRTIGGERPPLPRAEPDGEARLAVVKGLDKRARDALEAVDIAPRRVPAAEIGGQLGDSGFERTDPVGIGRLGTKSSNTR